MSIGTFGSFTQARLGIYAAQAGLSVTGNNIGNINTPGYTRQKLIQSSFYAGGSDRYYSSTSVRVGNGVLCKGVSQLRDPYLDIRYRGEMSGVGAMDSKLSALKDLQRILDEVGDGKEGFGILGNQLSDFYKQLQNLNDHTGKAEYDIQVRSSAEALVKMFNTYASQLESAEKNAQTQFKQDIEKVNTILNNIRDMNVEIQKAELHGDPALELRDERNVLIDELSTYMQIDVSYSMEDVGGGNKVEKLTIKLGGANPDPNIKTDTSTLIDGVYGTQISVPDQIPGPGGTQVDNTDLTVFLGQLTDSDGNIQVGSTEVQLADNDLFGAIQSQREFLTKAGEFSQPASEKRGIAYYKKSLDLLAKQFANTFNDANQGFVKNEKGDYLDKDGNVVVTKDNQGNYLDKGGQIILTKQDADAKTPDEMKKFLKDQGAHHIGNPLFSSENNADNPKDINASNICISATWTKGPAITNSFTRPTGQEIGSTDSSNIAHMIVLMNTKMDYTPDGSTKPMFNGSFNDMWTNMGNVLGNDMMTTSTMLNTYHSRAVSLDTNRDSVSSVDLNDEAMNLMQYSKSYNAACRLMTTLDSILDKLINGTGTLT